MRKIFRLSLGIIFILAGLAGLLLPFLPGIILLIMGLTLLGSKNKLIIKIKRLIRQRFNRSDNKLKPNVNLNKGETQ